MALHHNRPVMLVSRLYGDETEDVWQPEGVYEGAGRMRALEEVMDELENHTTRQLMDMAGRMGVKVPPVGKRGRRRALVAMLAKKIVGERR